MDNQLIKPKVFSKDGGTDIWLRARKKIKRKQGEIKRQRGRKTKQGKRGGERKLAWVTLSATAGTPGHSCGVNKSIS